MEKIHLKKDTEEVASPFFQLVLMPLLRYKRMTYTVVSVSLTVTLIYCLLISNWYTSTATILPSGGGGLSSLSSLAVGSLAELGLGSMMQADENSSTLYPKILKSRYISEKILQQKFNFQYEQNQYSITLYDYLKMENIDKAIEKLNRLVSINVDIQTGLIRLSVMTEYPEFSAAIVHAYLDALNEYNVTNRISKARANKDFIEKRLFEVNAELNTAETKLKEFQNKNRNYLASSDPELRQEHFRYQRDVTIKEAVMVELTKRYEMARVEAARDLPIVQVLDHGSVPIQKTKPKRSIYMLGALFGSLFVSIILSLWFEIARKRKIAYSFNQILSSPELEINRFEEKLIDTTSRTVNRIKGKLEKTDRKSVSTK